MSLVSHGRTVVPTGILRNTGALYSCAIFDDLQVDPLGFSSSGEIDHGSLCGLIGRKRLFDHALTDQEQVDGCSPYGLAS